MLIGPLRECSLSISLSLSLSLTVVMTEFDVDMLWLLTGSPKLIYLSELSLLFISHEYMYVMSTDLPVLSHRQIYLLSSHWCEICSLFESLWSSDSRWFQILFDIFWWWINALGLSQFSFCITKISITWHCDLTLERCLISWKCSFVQSSRIRQCIINVCIFFCWADDHLLVNLTAWHVHWSIRYW